MERGVSSMKSFYIMLLALVMLPIFSAGFFFDMGQFDSTYVSNEYCNGVDDNGNGQIDEGFHIGEPCNSTPNFCGDTNTGVYYCGGLYSLCSASAPAQRSVWNQFCVSEPNACGQVEYGATDCEGNCMAVPPAVYDFDSDGILDCHDNCRLIPNPDQNDTNHNGIGDLCESSDDYTFDYFKTIRTTPRNNVTQTSINMTNTTDTNPPSTGGNTTNTTTPPSGGNGGTNQTTPPGNNTGGTNTSNGGDKDDDDGGLDTDGDGDAGNQTGQDDGYVYYEGHGPFDPEPELVRSKLVRHYVEEDNTTVLEGTVQETNETDDTTVTIEDIAEPAKPFQPMTLLLGILAVFLLVLFVLYYRSTNE